MSRTKVIANGANGPAPEIQRIQAAMRKAVREALKRHKLASNPVAIWKDGHVAWVKAKDIPVK